MCLCLAIGTLACLTLRTGFTAYWQRTTLEFTNTIPFEIIDRFYFDEVVAQMPASLGELAVQFSVLYKDTTEQNINTLGQLDYLVLLWLFDDIFVVTEQIGLIIGQASVLLAISCIMLDRLVDRQMPDVPTIPLLQQQLLLKAGQLFGSQFESSDPFWHENYYPRLTEFVEALALESHHVNTKFESHTDTKPKSYTYELMRKVCVGKAAPLRVVTYALARSSGDIQPLEVIDSALNKLFLADQLNDDALDWRRDYQSGRYTLPVALALKAAGKEPENTSKLGVEELGVLLERHGILVYMVKQATSVLEEARTDLREANLENTKLYAFLGTRLEKIQRQRRYYQTIRLLGGLARALAKG